MRFAPRKSENTAVRPSAHPRPLKSAYYTHDKVQKFPFQSEQSAKTRGGGACEAAKFWVAQIPLILARWGRFPFVHFLWDSFVSGPRGAILSAQLYTWLRARRNLRNARAHKAGSAACVIWLEARVSFFVRALITNAPK